MLGVGGVTGPHRHSELDKGGDIDIPGLSGTEHGKVFIKSIRREKYISRKLNNLNIQNFFPTLILQLKFLNEISNLGETVLQVNPVRKKQRMRNIPCMMARCG